LRNQNNINEGAKKKMIILKSDEELPHSVQQPEKQ
jgi:hypothetical protein